MSPETSRLQDTNGPMISFETLRRQILDIVNTRPPVDIQNRSWDAGMQVINPKHLKDLGHNRAREITEPHRQTKQQRRAILCETNYKQTTAQLDMAASSYKKKKKNHADWKHLEIPT